MLEEESRRLDQLRRASHHDAATGLLNREHFLARARSVLAREDADAHGILLVARLIDLQALNRTHGWSLMDTQIRRFAEALATIPRAGGDWVAGRLSGSDFAVFAPGAEAGDELGRLVQEGFRSVAQEVGLGDGPRLAVAVTAYRHGEALAVVLERADTALAAAVAQGGSVVADGNAAPTSAASRQGELVTWRARFDTALEQGQVKLQSFPVVDAEGLLLHDECFARLRLGRSEDWQPAREFVPWLSRRGDLPRLDELVVDLAIEGLRDGTGRLCINLAAESLGEGSVRRIAAKLAAEPELADRLAIEVPEHGVFQHFDGFRLLCTLLVPLGCKVGIEHMGHEVSRIGALRDLGIDYVKVDASFTQGIEASSANQTFLRGLAMIVHAIGLRAIAEGVESESAFRTLMELGFDGATGPAITTRGG
jgi:EAL domain-containing protein (putative c-di-GMP-specific phosphodiesterase class I)/GGDEF domain-containing protein